ncbi:hypothetical protein ACJX0J_016842, partial [Zea mays]
AHFSRVTVALEIIAVRDIHLVPQFIVPNQGMGNNDQWAQINQPIDMEIDVALNIQEDFNNAICDLGLEELPFFGSNAWIGVMIMCLMFTLEEFRDLLLQNDYWKQRSKIIWVTLGEENAKFFHANASLSSKRKYISCLVNSDNQLVYSHDNKEKGQFLIF